MPESWNDASMRIAGKCEVVETNESVGCERIRLFARVHGSDTIRRFFVLRIQRDARSPMDRRFDDGQKTEMVDLQLKRMMPIEAKAAGSVWVGSILKAFGGDQLRRMIWGDARI